jgi:hypothetical protein
MQEISKNHTKSWKCECPHELRHIKFKALKVGGDHLCGLVVRVPGYRSGCPGSIPWHYKKKTVGLERGPLSLVSTTEELGRISSGSGLESRDTAVGIRHADHMASSIRKKLALTSLTSGGRSVGIVRLRTEATEFIFFNLVAVKSTSVRVFRLLL